jgi:ADP-ribose pyrophosphatase
MAGLPPQAKRVFKGVVFDVYQWEQELFDGSTAVFEKLKRADTVLVIPVTKDGKILLTEQEQPDKPPFVSFAGGRVEEGEIPETAAAREMLEETGYAAESLELWEITEPHSKIEWRIYTFIGRGCQKSQDPAPDAGERITVKEIGFEEFLSLADNPSFHERNITEAILRAKVDTEKMQELRRRLLP